MIPRERFYRPELDILRFLAFLAVFVLHASLFTRGLLAQVGLAGAFGLCLFFFLSAYLITELLDRECEATGTIRLGAFYLRRILRIWPLYVVAILADFLHAHLRTPVTFSTGRLAASLLLLGNWYTAQHGLALTFTMPLWSISVEEQFYVLWPSVRRYGRRHLAITVALATLVVSAATLVFDSYRGVDADTTVWVNSLVQFQFFASGALVALLLRHRTPHLHGASRTALFCFGVALLLAAQVFFHLKGAPHPAQLGSVLPGYLLVNLGCIVLFLSVLGSSPPRAARPLIYLGKISYGLYVFHYPMLIVCARPANALSSLGMPASAMALRALLALPATILVAHLSYRYFEAPILRYKQRFEVIRTRPVEPTAL